MLLYHVMSDESMTDLHVRLTTESRNVSCDISAFRTLRANSYTYCVLPRLLSCGRDCSNKEFQLHGKDNMFSISSFRLLASQVIGVKFPPKTGIKVLKMNSSWFGAQPRRLYSCNTQILVPEQASVRLHKQAAALYSPIQHPPAFFCPLHDS